MLMFFGSPDNIFSWNYHLQGPHHHAYWEKKWTTEQCSILIDGKLFEVKKHGVTSGRWTLERDGEVYCSAQKESVLRRSFLISGPMGDVNLGSTGALRRSFFMGLDGDLLGTISPRHVFSRHAKIELQVKEMDFPTLAFMFWLVILSWRRQHS